MAAQDARLGSRAELRPPAPSAGADPARYTLRQKSLLFIDLARSRSAVLSIGEAALGALLAARGIPSLRVVLLGLLAALAGYFCVYSLNDLLDLKADREEVRGPNGEIEWNPEVRHMDITTLRHPVAAGALSLSAGIAWVSLLGLIGLVAAYLLRPLCAILFVACALLQVLYCGLKHRTWLKVIPAGVMVGLGGLAGWFAVGEATWGALAFFVLLTSWEIFGRNLSNDLADLSHDIPLGITTVAAVRGPKAAISAIVLGASCMPLLALLQTGPVSTRLALALIAAGTMTVPAFRLRSRGGERAAQEYFNRASFFPTLAAASLVILSFVR
ncbi:MAG TPA: UbiA prenyltransferase family protein [Thermoleophilia bacterium]